MTSLVALFFFAILLVFSLWCLISKNWLFAFLRGFVGLAGAGFSVTGLLLSWQFLDFQKVESQRPLATVSSQQLGQQRYMLNVAIADQGDFKFELYGDSWQIDARILVWQGWLSWLGAEPSLRFERVSGRYADLSDEKTKLRSVEAFEHAFLGVDSWAWLSRFEGLPGMQLKYGNSVFVPMAQGAVYSLWLGDSGMQVKPENRAAELALNAW